MKMKKIWVALLLAGMSFGMGSCTKEDIDDIRKELQEHNDRLTSLEEWQKSVNTSISYLQSLIEALEDKDYVTAVTPLEDGTGYVISFLKSGNVTIKHGEKGEKGEDGNTPVISVKLDTDGKYYWTVNGEWLLDSGNKIPVTGEKGDKGDKGDTGTAGSDGLTPYIGDNGNWWIGTTDTGVKAQGNTGTDGQTPHIGDNGNWWIGTTDTGVKAQGDKGADAIAPQVRINTDTNEWEISIDNGTTWASTGVKATGDKGNTGAQGEKGDSMFSSIDNSNEDYVELTLADGVTKIKLPKYAAFSIAFESDEVFYASPSKNELTLVLPATLKESDYRSIIATVTETNGADVQTRSTGSRWGVSVTKPTFETDGALVEGSAKVTIKGTEDTHLADTYLLRVALVTANGTEVTASRLVKYFDGTIVEKQSDITDNTVSRLAWKGDMAEDDFAYIRNNMASTLEVLDLSATTLTELPTRALAFYSAQGYNGNNTLHTVILPESLVKTGWAAFGNCNNLQHVYLPSALTEITNWTFEMCYKLADVEIPRHVNTIGEGAFSNCRDLAEIRIPASVTAIPNWCFQLCMNLEQIYLHDGITSIGQAAFSSCPSLDHFTVPKGVTVLSENLFASCHGLREVYLHDGITAMKEGVFYCCTSLTYCTFPDYGENSLPVGLTEIGQNCFYNTALKQINMSGTQIKDIPDWAFYTCENLKEVAFPYDLETIGINAFSGCPFTSIVLPASLTEIRAWAFSSCNDLRFVECQATTPPILNEDSPFPNRVFKLTVPTGCADAYKDTSWNNYFENIQ